jgi:GH24 family phage-related lysozyme (muramidase)
LKARLVALAAMLAVAASLQASLASGEDAPGYPIPGATPAAANLIANFEGFSATPYNDAQTNGNCTIGYGTLLHRGPCTAADSAAYPNGVTRQQALGLLQNEANGAANTIDRSVTVPLTAQQRDALTSFVYNVGAGAFRGSTLLRDLNAGNTQGAANELLRWQNQNGHPVPGLLNRRNAERCYFLRGNTACQGPIRDARVALARARLVSGGAHAGKPVRLRGSGFRSGSVRLVAYVPGISPYRQIALHARADERGRFSLRRRVPRRIVDTLRWKVTATQGHRSATRYVVIKRD